MLAGNSVNILKTVNYPLYGQVVWNVNYISKLLKQGERKRLTEKGQEHRGWQEQSLKQNLILV